MSVFVIDIVQSAPMCQNPAHLSTPQISLRLTYRRQQFISKHLKWPHLLVCLHKLYICATYSWRINLTLNNHISCSLGMHGSTYTRQGCWAATSIANLISLTHTLGIPRFEKRNGMAQIRSIIAKVGNYSKRGYLELGTSAVFRPYTATIPGSTLCLTMCWCSE